MLITCAGISTGVLKILADSHSISAVPQYAFMIGLSLAIPEQSFTVNLWLCFCCCGEKMGRTHVQLGRRKGNVTHHATHIHVGVSGLGSAGVLMIVVLSYYLVTLLVRCEARWVGRGFTLGRSAAVKPLVIMY